MQQFNDLQQIWKQGNKAIPDRPIDFSQLRSQKQRMRNKFLFSASTLLITGFGILMLLYLLDPQIKSMTVQIVMVIMTLICWLQAVLQFINAKKLDDIDETQIPEKLLQQWQNFRTAQKNQQTWNMPIYYILLGTALGFYLFEIMKNGSALFKSIVFAVTYGWMFFAYFYLGKKQLKKQNAKIDAMIAELKGLENQFR